MKNTLILTAAITGLTLGTVGAAFAENTTENDALGIAKAQISLTEAIDRAEQHVGGQASRAEFEEEDGRMLFDVEVVKGSEVTDVKVDPASGKVLSAANDQVDQGDAEGDEEEDADD